MNVYIEGCKLIIYIWSCLKKIAFTLGSDLAATEISDIFVFHKKKSLPKVSIIIPCFNQGHFLKDALSGFSAGNTEYEIIIVNDGSTDARTVDALEAIRKDGFQVVHQSNQGLAAARNEGIRRAGGEFIMLLDADNKVEYTFIQHAARILDSDSTISVVYSDAVYFGAKSGPWKVGEFNLQKLMIENYIDACAMVRKEVFDELGGYDEQMKKIKSGWEDWEMWLRIAFAGKKFYYWPEVGFHYRVDSASMIGGIANSYEIRNKLLNYLHYKYYGKLGQHYITDHVIKRFRPHPIKFLLKLCMATWFRKKYQRMVEKNKIMQGL
ncbi:MAG: glycosyltransferase family 2 protein [Pedobacter sp.]|nr:MAG: glycosyltransferase family 2 protein [Pedobacter sp.]